MYHNLLFKWNVCILFSCLSVTSDDCHQWLLPVKVLCSLLYTLTKEEGRCGAPLLFCAPFVEVSESCGPVCGDPRTA